MRMDSVKPWSVPIYCVPQDLLSKCVAWLLFNNEKFKWLCDYLQVYEIETPSFMEIIINSSALWCWLKSSHKHTPVGATIACLLHYQAGNLCDQRLNFSFSINMAISLIYYPLFLIFCAELRFFYLHFLLRVCVFFRVLMLQFPVHQNVLLVENSLWTLILLEGPCKNQNWSTGFDNSSQLAATYQVKGMLLWGQTAIWPY